jgi:hypothetical protein
MTGELFQEMLKYIATHPIGMPTVTAQIPPIEMSLSMFSGRPTPP